METSSVRDLRPQVVLVRSRTLGDCAERTSKPLVLTESSWDGLRDHLADVLSDSAVASGSCSRSTGRALTTSPQGWVITLLLDPSNTHKQIRAVVAGTEWQGLHPHAFRHLVATLLDAVGLTAREIADYLGHERVSTTQDVYMSRKSAGDRAAADLERFGTGPA